jgi:hypothetical protein
VESQNPGKVSTELVMDICDAIKDGHIKTIKSAFAGEHYINEEESTGD